MGMMVFPEKKVTVLIDSLILIVSVFYFKRYLQFCLILCIIMIMTYNAFFFIQEYFHGDDVFTLNNSL